MAAIISLTSCATKQSVCVDPKMDDCYICQIAEKYNTTPEGIARFVESVNILAIYKNKYTATQALNELKSIREKLNTDIKYILLKELAGNLIKENPALFILSTNYSSYLNEFSSTEFMDEKSKSLLIAWIDKITMDMELIISLKE